MISNYFRVAILLVAVTLGACSKPSYTGSADGAETDSFQIYIKLPTNEVSRAVTEPGSPTSSNVAPTITDGRIYWIAESWYENEWSNSPIYWSIPSKLETPIIYSYEFSDADIAAIASSQPISVRVPNEAKSLVVLLNTETYASEFSNISTVGDLMNVQLQINDGSQFPNDILVSSSSEYQNHAVFKDVTSELEGVNPSVSIHMNFMSSRLELAKVVARDETTANPEEWTSTEAPLPRTFISYNVSKVLLSNYITKRPIGAIEFYDDYYSFDESQKTFEEAGYVHNHTISTDFSAINANYKDYGLWSASRDEANPERHLTASAADGKLWSYLFYNQLPWYLVYDNYVQRNGEFITTPRIIIELTDILYTDYYGAQQTLDKQYITVESYDIHWTETGYIYHIDNITFGFENLSDVPNVNYIFDIEVTVEPYENVVVSPDIDSSNPDGPDGNLEDNQ